jgi:hypothetical protein
MQYNVHIKVPKQHHHHHNRPMEIECTKKGRRFFSVNDTDNKNLCAQPHIDEKIKIIILMICLEGVREKNCLDMDGNIYLLINMKLKCDRRRRCRY